MIRFLNLLALGILMGSAVYAYSIKYETIYRTEQIAKIHRKINAERDAIAALRAEWAYLSRPERMQTLADKYLDLETTHPYQIVDFSALPERGPRIDSIARKLEDLGVDEPKTTGSTTARQSTRAAPASGER